MNNEDFKKLVGPLNMLIGFANSAKHLTVESSLEAWAARIGELSDNLSDAWDDVMANESTDEKTS